MFPDPVSPLLLAFGPVPDADGSFPRLDERSEEYILSVFNKNALFSLFLTRALLPLLRRAAASGPVLCAFTGSIAADISPARIPVYAASKGFLHSLVRGLDNDELYLTPPSGVRFAYLVVGSVHSDNHAAPSPVGFMTPTSEAFAKSIIARTGCGRRRVAPDPIHAAVQWVVSAMGHAVTDKASAEEMRDIIRRANKTD